MTEEEFAALLNRNPDIRRRVDVEVEHKRETFKAPAPTEAAEQRAVVKWAKLCSEKWPELRLLFHIPNGGTRGRVEAQMLYAEGVKAGVPDLFLPCARRGMHGLWIELKRADFSNDPSPAQVTWLNALRREGYQVEVCYGADAAIKVLQDYLEGR